MRISRDELIDLLDDVCTEVSRAVARHAEISRELAEDSLDQKRAYAQQVRIDRVKRELEDEKLALTDLRRRQKHKREIEAARKESERKRRQNEGKAANGLVALRNARGQLIGWLQAAGLDRMNVLDAKGRLVAREINGMTLDRCGRLVGNGKQGLVVLGGELSKN